MVSTATRALRRTKRRGRSGTLLRAVVNIIAILWAISLAVIALVILEPGLLLRGIFAPALMDGIALHLVLAGIVGIGLGWLTGYLGARKLAWGVTALALAATIVCCVPVVALWRAASASGASLSLLEHLAIRSNAGGPDASRSVTYNRVDGQDLQLDVWLPPGAFNLSHPAIIWVHGGGWASDHRGGRPDWDRWFTDHGYAVFDIDYRLTPPIRWNQAPADIKCAIGWVKAHASEYGVSPQQIVIAGFSAGGNLALMGAYAAGDPTIPASCAVGDTSVAAVIDLYGITDATTWWEHDAPFGAARSWSEAYTGGTPSQIPDRYQRISPIHYLRAGLPPTLLVHGTSDQVVTYDQSVELDAALTTLGVPHELVSLPYTDHNFDTFWGAFGSQITRHSIAVFLARYVPA